MKDDQAELDRRLGTTLETPTPPAPRTRKRLSRWVLFTCIGVGILLGNIIHNYFRNRDAIHAVIHEALHPTYEKWKCNDPDLLDELKDLAADPASGVSVTLFTVANPQRYDGGNRLDCTGTAVTSRGELPIAYHVKTINGEDYIAAEFGK